MRVKVWDAVVAAKFAIMCLGSESSKKTTRYQATGKLLTLRKEWELRLLVDLQLARNSQLDEAVPLSLVLLHTGKVDPRTGELLPEDRRKQPISFKHWPQEWRDSVRELEDRIERINRNNINHFKAFRIDPDTGRKVAFGVNSEIRQIFVGEMFQHGRLYSWGPLSGQNLPKAVRKTMLVDDEPAAELDFRCMIPRMIYHFAHQDPKGDITGQRIPFRRSLASRTLRRRRGAWCGTS